MFHFFYQAIRFASLSAPVFLFWVSLYVHGFLFYSVRFQSLVVLFLLPLHLHIYRALVLCFVSYSLPFFSFFFPENSCYIQGDCRVIALSETTRDQVVQSINLFLASMIYRVLIVSYEVGSLAIGCLLFMPPNVVAVTVTVTVTVTAAVAVTVAVTFAVTEAVTATGLPVRSRPILVATVAVTIAVSVSVTVTVAEPSAVTEAVAVGYRTVAIAVAVMASLY